MYWQPNTVSICQRGSSRYQESTETGQIASNGSRRQSSAVADSLSLCIPSRESLSPRLYLTDIHVLIGYTPAKQAFVVYWHCDCMLRDVCEALRPMANGTPLIANTPEPDRSEPSEARKAELRAAYQEGSDAPYLGVAIRTLGELLWIFSERKWSGIYDLSEYDLSDGTPRPNLRANPAGRLWLVPTSAGRT